MTDALDFISHQHARLQTLAAPLGIALASEEALDEGAVSELVAALSAHDAVERGYIFPLVAERLGRQSLLPAIEDHGRQARILSEIERRPRADPHRRKLIGDIVDAVHHHVHEEQTMMSLLRARMAPEELERVGESIEAALPRVPTRPHPHLGGSGGGARLSARLFAPVDHVRDRLRRRPRPPRPPATPRAPRRVDILRILERQHREMVRVLTDLTTSPGDEIARRRLAEYAVGAMARHEAAEELVLWPAVRGRVPGGDALADEALQQERQGRFFLDTLLATHDDPARRALATELLAAVQAHIAFEEGQVWPPLRRATTPLARSVIGTKYRVAFRVGPTRPHPHGPDRPMGLRTRGTAAAVSDRMRDKLTGRQT